VTYSPPQPVPRVSASVTIQKPREQVWQALIPQLARTFFVINNIDQTSGLINVSYSGDPERFVDCGTITITNPQGAKTYEFPAARAQQQYEVTNGLNVLRVTRTMSLEGRANLVLEAVSLEVTRATVNIRYVLTKHLRGQATIGAAEEDTQSISFSSGETAAFPEASAGQATTCHSTGQLERQLLDLLPSPAGGGSPPNTERACAKTPLWQRWQR
jgi:hypothetical protein